MAGKNKRQKGKHIRSRHVSKPGKNHQQKRSQRKHWVREWIEASVFAFVAVLAIHTFIFQPFIVPTPSMANTIMPGDFVIVSKLHYGARMPVSVGIPYTDEYIKGIHIPYARIPGFSEIRHGDVVVFNVPNEEEAVDRKTRYMKRVIGLPGDEVTIINKRVHVNGVPALQTPGMLYFWDVYTNDPRVELSPSILYQLGVKKIIRTSNPALVRLQATPEMVETIRSWSYVDRVEPLVQAAGSEPATTLFPGNKPFTPDNYGPISVPRSGDTVVLTPENLPLYREIISNYEGHHLNQLDDGVIQIDGEPASRYTFEQNYYFMMGDNRDDSLDSRFWGYVPEDHIIGKTVATFFSWDSEKHRPRFRRMIRSVE